MPSRPHIHILGGGNIGSLLAHKLVKYQRASNVTILVGDKVRFENFWIKAKGGITLRKSTDDFVKGMNVVRYPGLPKELSSQESKVYHDISNAREYGQVEDTTETETSNEDDDDNARRISNLIVTTKAPYTLRALERVVPYMDENSNILFLQNGLGILERVISSSRFWPKIESRPNMIVGITTHGVYPLTAPYTYQHAGLGNIKLGIVPNEGRDNNNNNGLSEFLNALTSTPELDCTLINYGQLLMAQYEKLIVNCCINPITAILDCDNGELLQPQMELLIKDIIIESCQVLKELIPLRNLPQSSILFNVDRLFQLVKDIAFRTKSNISSMRQDIQYGNPHTEIDYLNGYICAKQKQLANENIHVRYPRVNATMVRLVKAQVELVASRNDRAIPDAL